MSEPSTKARISLVVFGLLVSSAAYLQSEFRQNIFILLAIPTTFFLLTVIIYMSEYRSLSATSFFTTLAFISMSTIMALGDLGDRSTFHDIMLWIFLICMGFAVLFVFFDPIKKR